MCASPHSNGEELSAYRRAFIPVALAVIAVLLAVDGKDLLPLEGHKMLALSPYRQILGVLQRDFPSCPPVPVRLGLKAAAAAPQQGLTSLALGLESI